MFGYVRPLKGELKVSEFERYKAVYCGLCKSLGKNYGFAARFTVSYDLTFFAALLMSSEDSQTARCRCPACAVKRKTAFINSKAVDEAANKSVILAWFSLLDKRKDGNIFAKCFYGSLSLLLRPAVNKARKIDVTFYQTALEKMKNLDDLEKAGRKSLDVTADCFASLLSCAVPDTITDSVKRPMSLLMYNVGRFIYLADAYDDYSDDLKHGCYNPIAARYDLSCQDIPHDITKEVDILLENCFNMCASAIALLDLGKSEPIVCNIIYLGLPAVWRSVKSGTFNKRASQENT